MNDYCQHFVDSGLRPQNFIRDSGGPDRLSEYPKLQELVRLKDAMITEHMTPSFHLKCDLRQYDLKNLGAKFDVILVDPPWEDLCAGSPGNFRDEVWTNEEIARLSVPDIAESRCFLFFWVGSSDGLEAGRDIMNRWGFRRCEVIVWLKTNKVVGSDDKPLSHNSATLNTVCQHTMEHCLMGIKGTVRRSVDTEFIHSNVDTDVIISENPAPPSTRKPEELYSIIQRFCLGRKRIELFGQSHNVRPGWVTLGNSLELSDWDPERYLDSFRVARNVPTTNRIEALRPKSPNRRTGGGSQQRRR